MFSLSLLFKDEFLALSEEMSQFYKSYGFPVNEVFECQVYAACIDDNPNIWHRVIVEEVKEDGQVYLIRISFLSMDLEVAFFRFLCDFCYRSVCNLILFFFFNINITSNL